MALLTWRVLVTGICSVLLLLGFYTLLTSSGENRCEMTYMFEKPQYIKISLPKHVQDRYPQYRLFIYGEGRYAEDLQTGVLTGMPVLFVPGNAGSYRQVRSLASVALRMTQSLRTREHFNFFAIDTNNELSALYGGVLWDQTAFLKECVEHVLSLYTTRGLNRTVVMIGHSMGGVLARALFLMPSFNAKSISVVYSLASPHYFPVLELDSLVSSFYHNLEALPSTGDAMPFAVSVGGGLRDLLVRSDLVMLPADQGLSVVATAIPGVWLSTDHLCIVWCKQLVKNIVRSLFTLISKENHKVIADASLQRHIFHRSLIQGSPEFSTITPTLVTFSQAGEWITKDEMAWRVLKNKVLQAIYILIPLKSDERIAIHAKGLLHPNWVFSCQVLNDSNICDSGESISTLAHIVPSSDDSYEMDSKSLHLVSSDLLAKGHTHLLIYLMPSVRKVNIVGERYKKAVRHKIIALPSLLRTATATAPLKIITVPLSEGALFYNISLKGLDQSWQAYSFVLETRVCRVGFSGSAGLARFHVPWSFEDRYYVIKSSLNARTEIESSIYQSRSNTSSFVQLHFLLAPECSYSLTVHISSGRLVAQFLKLYSPYLLSYFVAILLAVLCHQLFTIGATGLCPSLLKSLDQSQAFIALVILPEVFYYILNYLNVEIPFLPSTDDTTLRDRHLRTPFLRFCMFWVAYSCLNVLALVTSAFFTVVGDAYVWITLRSRKPVFCDVEEVTLYPWLVFLSCAVALLGIFWCGAIAILLSCLFLVFKVIYLCGHGRYQEHHYGVSAVSCRWHLQHTLLHLHLCCSFLVLPSFLHWLHIITWHLPRDPHAVSAFILTLSWAVLWQRGIPTRNKLHYRKIGVIILVLSILASMYCLVNTWRVSHLLATAQALIAAQQMAARNKNKQL